MIRNTTKRLSFVNKQVTVNPKELEADCPDGYSINRGQTVDMLGATELWRIHEHHAEPELTRIPQDLVDYGIGMGRGPKRIPREWGRCLYYKLV